MGQRDCLRADQHFLQKITTMRLPKADLSSLRVRLILIPTAILLAGLVATIVLIVAGARGRVQAEVQSGMRLGEQLLLDALHDVRQSPDIDIAYKALIADLPRVRHVTFAFSDVSERKPHGLLARALAPTPVAQTFPVTIDGRLLGTIIMRSNPYDEIDEILGELVTLAVLLVTIWAATIVLIGVAVSRGLRPLRQLAAAFDHLERGEAVSVPSIETAELRRVGAQFNSLSRALAEATADNRHLIERLMSAQEAERRELARELHDEIGPLLFGMRADAACILRWSAEGKPAGIPARARSLAMHADGLQRINSRMLARMRPMVLDEMGLAEALRALVASWRARLPEVVWTLDMPDSPPEPDPGLALTVFRVVQEALTNSARHAEARRVLVALATGSGALHLQVRDDGRGLPEGTVPGAARRGYGLLGMTERVRQAGGTFSARRAPEGGTLVEARLPLEEAACVPC